MKTRIDYIVMATSSAACTGLWAHSILAAGAVGSAFMAFAWLAEEYLAPKAGALYQHQSVTVSGYEDALKQINTLAKRTRGKGKP